MDKDQAELQAHVIKSALDNNTNTVIATAQADGEYISPYLCDMENCTEECPHLYLDEHHIASCRLDDNWQKIKSSIAIPNKVGQWERHNTGHSIYYDCSLCRCLAPCTETADSWIWKLSKFVLIAEQR